MRSRGVLGLVLLTVAGAVLLSLDARTAQPVRNGSPAAKLASNSSSAPSSPSTAKQQQIRMAYSQLPLSFELNQGQTDSKVRFLARGGGYGLFLTADEAVLKLRSSAKNVLALRMALDGANKDVTVVGTDELPGKSNYFIGNDPKQWHRDVPQFARVRYQNVYPGIDLVYYGNQGRLEYDFEVAPGVDSKQVNLHFRGSNTLRIDNSGNLVLATGAGNVKLEAPRVYQNIGGKQRIVAGKFALRAKDQVGFDLGDYDRSRTLVIDPQLTFSTYLGGSGAESCSAITGLPFTPGCPAIAVDSGLNAYIAGSTESTNFPPLGEVAGSLKATANVFIAKFDSEGSSLVFSTYFGGTGAGKDYPAGIAVDSGFNVYVAGTTSSDDFPTLNGLTVTPAAGNHVFVSKFNSGANLQYSTLLAGSAVDSASGVAIDSLGRIYVTGATTSTDFPTTANSFSTLNGFVPPGSNELFFSKLDPTANGLSALLYSTYLFGTKVNTGVTPTVVGGGIAVDTNCDAYISGGTSYNNMLPLTNAYQALPTSVSGTNAWLAEFAVPTNSNCGSDYFPNYATYFGGTGNDVAYGIAVDTGHNTYITGSTTSSDIAIPTTDAIPPFQSCPGVANTVPPVVPAPACSAVTATDAFLAKFAQPITGGITPGAVTLTYFTYLGGAANDAGLAVVADTTGGARITGFTQSGDFPNSPNPVASWQPGFGGGTDAFYARIDTTTTSVSATTPTTFSTFLGGSGTDIGTSIAQDFQSSSYVTGETSSGNFPTHIPFQGALAGPSDVFLTKLGPLVSLSTTVTATPTPVGVGSVATFTYSITNNSTDPTSGIVFTDNLDIGNATFGTATANPGSCTAVANLSISCSIGILQPGQIATVTVTLTATLAGPLSNNGYISSPVRGATSSTTVTVTDFSIAPTSGSPTTVTVPAGVPAVYNVQVTPIGGAVPGSITLSCSALPSAVGPCSFTGGSSITNLNNGPQSRVLEIPTVARVTTTTGIQRHGGLFYAFWFPVSGLALLGVGGKLSRRRRVLMAAVLAGFFGLILFQAGCGSTSTTTSTSGTPAGTYTITVNAVSGSATRSTPIQLIVQ
ncbi:MAG TPA: SBBP repeat-containing protein [Terriglobales bacterium]|nr:SBBP repeat-containing protein [Terriglobales bacterium]